MGRAALWFFKEFLGLSHEAMGRSKVRSESACSVV